MDNIRSAQGELELMSKTFFMEREGNSRETTCASLISVVHRGAGGALDGLVRFAHVAHLREVLHARSKRLSKNSEPFVRTLALPAPR